MYSRRQRVGVSRAVVVVAALAVVVILVAGAFVELNLGKSQSQSSQSEATQSQGSTSSASSASSSSSSSSSSSTLKIDGADFYGSISGTDYLAGPYPNWEEQVVYQSLLGVNETSMFQQGQISYEPELATNFTLSSDGTVYTFNLQPNAHFSNGDKFNAYQVWMEMYGYYYLYGNATGFLNSLPVFDLAPVTFGPSTITFITNNGGVTNPDAAAVSIMSNSTWPIYAPSAYQIVFHLDGPYTNFPTSLMATEGLIYDAQYVLNNGGFGTPTEFNPYLATHNIPGTGPYMVSEFVNNDHMTLTQDPNYWADKLPASQLAASAFMDPGHYKTIIVYGKTDDLTRYTDLATGAVQIASIGSSNWDLVTSQPDKFSYYSLTKYNTWDLSVSLNVLSYPTNITLVRQAIAHGINVTDIAQKALSGGVTPTVGPEYSLFSQFYDLGKLPAYSYNTTLAAQELAQAGFPGGKGLPTLTMWAIATQPYMVTMAEIVQSDLAQIGINVDVQLQLSSNFYAVYNTYPAEAANPTAIPNIGVLLWAGTTLNPGAAWSTFVSNSSVSGNWAAYGGNPVVERCVNSFRTLNTSLQVSACTAAQQQVYNDVPYVWIGAVTFPAIGGGAYAPVWDKGTIKSMLWDPGYGGNTDVPLLNTITPGT